MTKDIIQKIESGDPLTDEELRVAIKFYSTTEQNLASLGKAFSHARRAVDEQLQSLQRWSEARATRSV